MPNHSSEHLVFRWIVLYGTLFFARMTQNEIISEVKPPLLDPWKWISILWYYELIYLSVCPWYVKWRANWAKFFDTGFSKNCIKLYCRPLALDFWNPLSPCEWLVVDLVVIRNIATVVRSKGFWDWPIKFWKFVQLSMCSTYIQTVYCAAVGRSINAAWNLTQ